MGGCSSYHTKSGCIGPEYTDGQPDQDNCAWCINYMNSTMNSTQCIAVNNYCTNSQQCDVIEFSSDSEKCSYLAAFVVGMTFLSGCLALCIVFVSIKGYKLSNKMARSTCGACCSLFIVALVASIWYAFHLKDNEAALIYLIVFLAFVLGIIMICLLAISIPAFIALIKHIYAFVIKPVNKYGLISLVILIWILFISGFVIVCIQLIIKREIISSITYLSLLILGIDLVELVFEIQTKESKSLLLNSNSSNANIEEEEEQKYEQEEESIVSHDESIDEEHSTEIIIWQLLAFIVQACSFIVLAFIFEEYEPCFMNWATVPPVAVNIKFWMHHNGISVNSHQCCKFKLCLLFIILSLIGFSVVSCICNEDCIGYHVVVIMMAFLWSLTSLTHKHFLSKK